MTSHAGEFTRFIGRRHELSQIRQLLSGSRLVTLTGIGGAGKTRIARRLTNELYRTFREQAWMVELADLSEPDLLGHTVASAMGLQVQAEFKVSLIADFLGESPALLTMDNCEHLTEHCARLAGELLVACPGLVILATSRMPLGIAGEAVFQVPPLSVPDTERLPPVQAFAQYESVTLFVERATSALPSFQLSADNAEAVARLVNALEGIPLALELAAALIRVLPPEAMLERINDRYRLLNRGFRNAPARQQSLMASVEWSFELCTPDEQRLWSRLAVFTGGFELDAAEAVCAGNGLDRADILDLVTSLLDKSVLVRTDTETARFRMLETIRQYGVAQLEEAGELDLWRTRHRDWFAELADRSYREWVGPEQIQWIQRLRNEHPNLRAALEHAVKDPETAPIALRVCHALEHFWICSGHFSEARHWGDRALAHGTGTVAERTLALHICVWLAALQMDLDYAERRLADAYAVGGSSDDDVVQGYLRFSSGALATWQADVHRGLPLMLEGVELFHRAGHLNGEVHLRFFAAMSLGWAQEFERAAALHRECIALADERHEVFWRSYSLWALGLDSLMALDLDKATALEQESLRVKWAVKDNLGIALVLEALGWVAAAEGRGERGATLLGAADSLWRVIGMSLTTIPYISAQRETGESLARGTLSERDFERAFQEGAAMTTAEGVAFALEEVARTARGQGAEHSPLTRREEEVADLVAQGLSNRAIATRLVISNRTAQGHVENILRKLGFSSRTQVAAWVAERRAADSTPERHLRAVGGTE